MQGMILIVTPSTSGPQCAELIGKALNQPAKLVTSLRQAIASIRNEEYRVVVMDEDLFETSPTTAAGITELSEGAVMVFLNFGIASSDRVVREVKAAICRRERDEATARHSAALQLQGELGNDLTGILVSAQAALKVPDLPPAVQERLSKLYEIARKLQLRLQTGSSV
ncbi:MAG TPA: hypothetical protein VKW78_15595 [Terriglobales bacterium]|nr:hypothetical protein [Terriglobales bacterium]